MTKTIKEAAYEYLDKGMVVIPIKQHDKAPAITAWQKRTLEDVCIEQDFPEGAGRNMGVLLGSVSGGIVDTNFPHKISALLYKAKSREKCINHYFEGITSVLP